MTTEKFTPKDAKNPDARPATGEGMPDRQPRDQAARTEKQDTAKDSAVEASLELPSDRDQSKDMTGSKATDQRSPDVEQASRDVGKGLKDTSKAPEMDATYKKL